MKNQVAEQPLHYNNSRKDADSFPSARLVGFSGESGLARGSVTLSVFPECPSFVSFLWQDKKDTPRRVGSIDDHRILIYYRSFILFCLQRKMLSQICFLKTKPSGAGQ